MFGMFEPKPTGEVNHMIFKHVARENIKTGLGVRGEYEFLVERLNESLDDTYMINVKDRVLRMHQMDKFDYEWYLIELKRFFLMALVFKNVPMYNRNVDIIWHEMLMFTREYQDFCRRLAGRMIHHAPNVGGTAISQIEGLEQRGWYEVCYQELYIVEEENVIMLDGFGAGLLRKKMMSRFIKDTEYADSFFTNYDTEESKNAKGIIKVGITNKFINFVN